LCRKSHLQGVPIFEDISMHDYTYAGSRFAFETSRES
jgi:hypothetical protein